MKSCVLESEQALMQDKQSHRTPVPYSPSEGWRNSPRPTGARAPWPFGLPPSSHSLSHHVALASRGQSLFDREMMKESIPLVEGWRMVALKDFITLRICALWFYGNISGHLALGIITFKPSHTLLACLVEGHHSFLGFFMCLHQVLQLQ